MKLKFLNARDYEGKLKCVIQSNGKLNFSASAIRILGLNNQKSIKFALNEDEKGSDDLYLIILDEITDDAFKVNKAGNYYYLNSKSLFDSLGIDYKSQSIIFDIANTEEVIGGLPLYKLNRRKGKVRKSRKK